MTPLRCFLVCVSILLCILPTWFLCAQVLPFQRFTTEDGLSQGTITAIVQDHRGFMWIGTQDGLNRFDGVEFKTYRHSSQDTSSLSSSWVTSLYEDRTHNLWVGTLRGLNRFDRRSESFVRHYYLQADSMAPARNQVQAIHETYIGGISKLWIAMGRLFMLDRERGVFVSPFPNPEDPRLDGSIQTIREDHEGFLWAGTDFGLFRFDPRNGTISHSLSLEQGVTAIEVLRNGDKESVWFGNSRGLFQLNLETGRVRRHGDYGVASFLEDRSGQLWLSTSVGLGRLTFAENNNAFISFYRHDPGFSNSLSDNYVHCLFEDSSSSLWVGTYNGLNRTGKLSPGFTVYRHRPDNANSLGHDFVLPIMEDRDGNIWFGTFGGGVSVLQNNRTARLQFDHIKHDPARAGGLQGDNVRSLLQDRTGTIWIGTNDGLNVLDPGTRSVEHRLPFWSESLLETRDGMIWSGTTKAGLVKIERIPNTLITHATERGQFRSTRYPLDGRLGAGASEEIHALFEDRHGALWVGTEVGLVRFDRDSRTYVRFVHEPADSTSLSNDNVWCIAEDPLEEILWIGTSQGLNRFDKQTGKFRRYLEQEGFPNDYVYGILRDDLERLWLSTNHGLTRFDDRRPEGRKFKNFDVSDGIQANEFNRHSHCKLSNGEFLFGGTHGVTRFHPMQIQDNPYVPPVVLTAFTKFGKRTQFDSDIADVAAIELNYDENVFAFEFAALNYTNSSKNQYSYMMSGFDKDWVYSGTRRYASYTHLDPGDYVFRVKGSNNDGVWNEQGVSVRVTINPPFWGTWWFRLLTSVTVIASLLMFYQRRVNGLEKEKRTQQEFSIRLMESQENERKRIAGELHDSLVQNLLVAKNRSLLGMKKAGNAQGVTRELSEISDALTEAIDEVREIAHNLRPYHLDRLGLSKALRALIERMRESSTVEFRETIDPIDPSLNPENSIQLFRVVQEGINNILKHSGATIATLSVKQNGKMIDVVVSDDGKGFIVHPTVKEDERHATFGLGGIEQRVAMMNGTWSIQSSRGSGTTINIHIPVKG